MVVYILLKRAIYGDEIIKIYNKPEDAEEKKSILELDEDNPAVTYALEAWSVE